MNEKLRERFFDFVWREKFTTKGKLSLGLVITRLAKDAKKPLDADQFLTKRGGQVLGLGGPAVQKILGEYGIDRILAREGGRTSRGNIENMRKYVDFLNQLDDENLCIWKDVEKLWIDQVKVFFAGKPFKLNLDESLSVRTIVKDILQQAKKRQEDNPHMQVVGAVLQHLVGAKLQEVMEEKLDHHSFSTSDSQKDRPGDFFINDVVIHVTTAPSEHLIEKCLSNLTKNLKPIIITTERGAGLAKGLAENKDSEDRIDVFEIEQFLASNIYELGDFERKKRETTLHRLIKTYNEIISSVETDPSLKIELS